MNAPEQIVFIIDDDDGFRESVDWLLQAEEITTMGFSSAKKFLENYQDQSGCILLDVRMPDINGLTALQLIRDKGISIPVIMISGHGDIPIAVNAMKNGAQDFIEKPFDDEHLIRTINQNLSIASEIASENAQKKVIEDTYNSLTRREKEVMKQVILGQSNKQIAETLEISPKTVEVHRAKVMKKMQADSLPLLVKLAGQLNCF